MGPSASGQFVRPPNQRVRRTHSRVTPLAEDRKRRAARRAADAQRWAAKQITEERPKCAFCFLP
jgi:hypothetical protein